MCSRLTLLLSWCSLQAGRAVVVAAWKTMKKIGGWEVVGVQEVLACSKPGQGQCCAGT